MDYDDRLFIFKRAHFMCEYDGCDNRATEIAHKIANTIENIRMIQRILREQYNIDATKEYVKKKFIDSKHNLASSCRVHNDYFNCAHRQDAVDAIIKKCMEEL